jgi:hypothetical protein
VRDMRPSVTAAEDPSQTVSSHSFVGSDGIVTDPIGSEDLKAAEKLQVPGNSIRSVAIL